LETVELKNTDQKSIERLGSQLLTRSYYSQHLERKSAQAFFLRS